MTDNRTLVVPNPSNSVFRVDLEGAFDLKIIDFAGKVVYHGHHNSSENIDVRYLKRGMYIFRIDRDQQIINRKIMIR